MKLIIAGMLILGAAAQAQATEMLYLNLDNKSWTIHGELYTTHEDCDKAARRAIRNKEAFGAACTEFIPVRDTQTWRPAQQDSGQTTKEQGWINERNQIEQNRRERYEHQFYRPTPSMGR